jgi:hypothetical protein
MRTELNQVRAESSVLSEARRIAERERDAALREEARKDGILKRVEAEAAESEKQLNRCVQDPIGSHDSRGVVLSARLRWGAVQRSLPYSAMT